MPSPLVNLIGVAVSLSSVTKYALSTSLSTGKVTFASPFTATALPSFAAKVIS